MKAKAVWYAVVTCACVISLCAAGQASTPCPTPTTVGVVICAPGNEDFVASPVEISAAGKGNAQLKAWKVYVDGTGVWTSTLYVNSIDPSIPLAAGQHRVTAKAWDVNGSTYSQTIYITVPPTSSSGCTATVDRTVVICRAYVPISRGVTIYVNAAAKDQRPLAAMKIYVNGVAYSACTQDAAQLAASGNQFSCVVQFGVSYPGPSIKVTVKAWDSLGAFSATTYVPYPPR